MKSPSSLFKATVLLLAGVGLVTFVSCKPETPPNRAPQTDALISPIQTPTTVVSVLPTPTLNPEDIEPTIAPSPTLPPIPTPVPTPVVTPIPVASPPFIPEVVGKPQQPFWIYYWQGNEVWRVDDQGKDRQLVIDTYKTLGQYLTDIPDPYKNSDCCWIGPRVVVSPDGQKLALVVVDKIKGSKNDQFTFSIYVLDARTGDLKAIDEGLQPVWSLDNRQIAFLKHGTLWVGDLESGQPKKYAEGDPGKPEQRVWEMTWSPDSKSLAYLLGESMETNPEFWIVDVDNPSGARLLLPATAYARSGLSWSPDGKLILYRSSEGVGNGPNWSDNLWAISATSGSAKQLTQDMTVNGWSWSPDGKWLNLCATRQYEQPLYLYDTWLLNFDSTKLVRVSSAPPEYCGVYWSPDETRLVSTSDNGKSIKIFSLNTAMSVSYAVGMDIRGNLAVGGAK